MLNSLCAHRKHKGKGSSSDKQKDSADANATHHTNSEKTVNMHALPTSTATANSSKKQAADPVASVLKGNEQLFSGKVTAEAGERGQASGRHTQRWQFGGSGCSQLQLTGCAAGSWQSCQSLYMHQQLQAASRQRHAAMCDAAGTCSL